MACRERSAKGALLVAKERGEHSRGPLRLPFESLTLLFLDDNLILGC